MPPSSGPYGDGHSGNNKINSTTGLRCVTLFRSFWYKIRFFGIKSGFPDGSNEIIMFIMYNIKTA